MSGTINDKVAIIGMGCSKFGERWESTAQDLMIEAFVECLNDAGIEKKEIQAAYYGLHYDGISVGKSSIPISVALKLPYIPVSRLENYCATGIDVLRGASYAVASGTYDMVLAMGAEKLKDTGYGGLPTLPLYGVLENMIEPNAAPPGNYAMLATAYNAKYGVPMEKVKRAMAHISVKSHANGNMNPRAHLHRVVSEAEVLNAPMIAYPLGLYDCCGVSDGAAAAIVTTPEIAHSIKKDGDFVLIKALQIATTSGEESIYNNWDGAHFETATRAAIRAYEEAGIKNPREEVSMIEVHDCFSITELVTMEDLQISPRGKACDDVLDGFYDLDGKVPCQVDGGLKCFGHPIAASGLRMVYAIYEQMLERVPEERRVKHNVRIGLTHNVGGAPNKGVCGISIIGRE
jgi:acetyl-CoA C-acetyltransferase